MESCPDWYPVLVAARSLNCTPWELLDPDDRLGDPLSRILWGELATGALECEAHAVKMLQRLHPQGT